MRRVTMMISFHFVCFLSLSNVRIVRLEVIKARKLFVRNVKPACSDDFRANADARLVA